MSNEIKTKKTFGTATIDHFSPPKQDEWPKAINSTLSMALDMDSVSEEHAPQESVVLTQIRTGQPLDILEDKSVEGWLADCLRIS